MHEKEMKRETVEKIIEATKEINQAINQLITAVQSITEEDDAARRRMARFIAEMISDLHVEITLAAIKDYPELHPDFPDGSFRWRDYEAFEKMLIRRDRARRGLPAKEEDLT
jgi:hypothetical protein